ncbi:MAG: C25 family cysteine peptidase, partial [bacterium]
LPVIVSIVCKTGDFGNLITEPCFGETWIRTGTPANLKGGVAFYGPSDLHTNTKWNNALYAGFFEGLLEENLYRIGQAVVRSKFELYYGFPENTGTGDYSEFYFHVYNILGDPELAIWTDTPDTITLIVPTQIQPGQQQIEATVTKMDGSPLGGAYVAFFKADEILTGGVTGGDGKVAVWLDTDSAGTITVTASQQNCLPQQASLLVIANDFPLGITGIAVGGDGIAAAGETFDLAITLHNYGSISLSGIVAELSSADVYTTVNQAIATLGTITAESNGAANFQVTLSTSAPEDHAIEFTLALSDDAAHSSEIKFVLPVSSLFFISAGDFLESGSLNPGSLAGLRLSLLNVGTQTAAIQSSLLTSNHEALTVSSGAANFPLIQPGAVGQSSSAYTVSVNPSAAMGTQVIVNLLVTSTQGFTQNVSFPLTLGTLSTTDPLGPDSYGYYAYDDTDADYPEAPIFDWIELDPNYAGSSTGATYHPMGDDESLSIALPFTFTYYGEEYDSLTICSNGWAAFSETWMANFRNWNIPSALGPPLLIAPFWDDLKADTTGGNSHIKVFTRYDSAEGRFVVLWSRVINRFGYENYSTWKIETFEMILHDPVQNPTATGDGEIVFQYLEVQDIDDNNNYATVGIEDNGHVRGLQYAYSNDYPDAAAQLEDQRAIKFTTDPPDTLSNFGSSSAAGSVLHFFAPAPNPANPNAELRFALPYSGRVTLTLYNTLGAKVANLLDRELNAGEHRLTAWGDELSSGVYFAVLRFQGEHRIQKVLFLK